MIKSVFALVRGQGPRLARHWRALVLSGGVLVAAGLPEPASADESQAVLAFVAGTAVGVLLSADDDRHVHHHHGYAQPAYVVARYPAYYPARAHYLPPPVQVVHYYEPPRHHKRHHRRGGWERGRRGHYDD